MKTPKLKPHITRVYDLKFNTELLLIGIKPIAAKHNYKNIKTAYQLKSVLYFINANNGQKVQFSSLFFYDLISNNQLKFI